jgi:ABC-type transport system involved in multi-copper enzyme maturation permease subunit
VSLWQTLMIDNPMLIEVRRYRRRMLGGGRPNGVNIAVLTLGAVCYVGLLMIVGNGNGTIPPIVIILIQTGIFTLAAPAVLNNAIAGEREKRTWDLLLVAPVTKAQIMMGKFAGAMTNLVLGSTLFLLPTFICAVSYRNTDFFALFLAELDSLTFAMFACSVVLFFSARCKRAFTALAMSLGMLLLGLVVYPILIGAMTSMDRLTVDFLLFFHPFVVQIDLMTLSHMSPYMSESSRGTVTPAIIQICVFIGLSIVMFVWTERTLTYSDNETKFIPKRHA